MERWGTHILIRPDPQVLWNTPKTHPLWRKAHARYHRSKTGGGQWELYRAIPDVWHIGYRDLRFGLKPMGFKHTGLFPEQAVNWDAMRACIADAGRPVRLLNLFGYTGAATLACAAAGAHVTHVDAAKGMVGWAKENRELNRLPETSFRWIVEDALRFVQREIRRGNRYDGILMDPPSYGRGPKGEIWKIEDAVWPLVKQAAQLLSDRPLFFLINSYTTGLQPAVLTYMLNFAIGAIYGGKVESSEIGLPVGDTGLVLPCGASGRWTP